jgi:NADH:ubiquinone oxidoreductase subunit 6 (subunit J)
MASINTIVFILFAALAIIAAIHLVTSSNIVHSAFALVVTIGSIAVLYVLLDAYFLAAAQVLIYAGAVCVLVVFAVMLTLRGDVQKSNLVRAKWFLGAAVAGLLLIITSVVIIATQEWWVLPGSLAGTDTTVDLSMLLFSRYMVPFEIAAFMLTMALIGAVVLAKGVGKRNEP